MRYGLKELIPGSAYTIYGLEKDGHCAVEEFLSSVEKNDLDALDSLLALLERMANHGPGHNKQKFRDVGNDIYEFKAKHLRICWFYDAGRMVICTHGFGKGAKKVQSREIKDAGKERKAYFEAKKITKIPITRVTKT